MNNSKKKIGGRVGGSGSGRGESSRGWGGGGLDGCEVKFLRKKKSGVWSVFWGGHGGCERSIEVFVKIKKKIKSGEGRSKSGGGGQGGCEHEDVKFL